MLQRREPKGPLICWWNQRFFRGLGGDELSRSVAEFVLPGDNGDELPRSVAERDGESCPRLERITLPTNRLAMTPSTKNPHKMPVMIILVCLAIFGAVHSNTNPRGEQQKSATRINGSF